MWGKFYQLFLICTWSGLWLPYISCSSIPLTILAICLIFSRKFHFAFFGSIATQLFFLQSCCTIAYSSILIFYDGHIYWFLIWWYIMGTIFYLFKSQKEYDVCSKILSYLFSTVLIGPISRWWPLWLMMEYYQNAFGEQWNIHARSDLPLCQRLEMVQRWAERICEKRSMCSCVYLQLKWDNLAYFMWIWILCFDVPIAYSSSHFAFQWFVMLLLLCINGNYWIEARTMYLPRGIRASDLTLLQTLLNNRQWENHAKDVLCDHFVSDLSNIVLQYHSCHPVHICPKKKINNPNDVD